MSLIPDLEQTLWLASIWVLPVLLAITLHEAAHAIAASWLGDPTARIMGRVSLNPIRHIDPYGTVLIPGLLLLANSPFLFGYAKPVPVNFSRLRNPRRDMALVAVAGPTINIMLAYIAALFLHTVSWAPGFAEEWYQATLINMILLNLVLAIFNMLPIPPLDGGRILVAILPDELAWRVARLERVGLFIVIGVLFLIPFLGEQLGVKLEIVETLVMEPVQSVARFLLDAAGH